METSNPDLIIGTETWLHEKIKTKEFFLNENYDIYRNDRKNRTEGGVLIAVGKVNSL